MVHADETGTAVGTTKHWVHTLTTNLLTLVAVHPKRGREAMADIGVLAGYTGTIVHDGCASYDIFTAASHAQCGAHLLRHIAGVGQAEAFATWASHMTAVPMEAKVASEAAAGAGLPRVEPGTAGELRSKYFASVDSVFELLPPGPMPRRRHSGGWSDAERKAWNLATRMRDDAGQVLRFLDDTRAPFTNNRAEKSLRMVKLHDKVPGPFHCLSAAESFADCRSYLQTAANHGESLLGVLRQLFTTGPWLPAEVAPG
ncbi:MAG: IS66 family transposase [Acidimicrobiales bacterium]